MGQPLSIQLALALVHDAQHLRHARPRHGHRFHGVREGADYIGLFLAAGLSWVALPGPGEAALIAAGISSAHGHLDLTTVIASAWAGACVGGMAGWLIGVKGGRALLTVPGVLHRLRLAQLERGERFYERFGSIAVLLAPSWMAGIHNMRWSRFMLVNALSALIWAVWIGVGAYLLGPSITDVVADEGLVGGIVIAVVFVLAMIALRRRSSKRRGG